MNGYVDLQVNGYAGVDFNDESTTDEQLIAVCQRLRTDRVDAILATIITAHRDPLIARIQRITRFCEAYPDESRVIAGLHIEGPFISPLVGYVGAHPPDAVVPADIELTKRILEAGAGRIRLLTLAPEMDAGAKVTSYLAKQNVLVSAGHSEASLQLLDEFIDAGLAMWTHLGNGCPGTLPRHDNIIQRVLSRSDRLSISFIADGHHVPVFALRNYLKLVPTERVVIVSDAMLAAGLGPGRYWFANQNVEVDQDGAAWCEDRTHLAGSAATLVQMEDVLRNQLGATDEQIRCWTCDNPKKLLQRN
jgi:N-acetylglucosamine-6-phosphate deacetylase